MANVGFESEAAALAVVEAVERLRDPGGLAVRPGPAAAYQVGRVVALQADYIPGHSLGVLVWYDPADRVDKFRPGYVLVRFADGTAPPAGTRDVATISGVTGANGSVFGVYTIERGSVYGYYPGPGGPPDGDLVTVEWTDVSSVSLTDCCVVYSPVKRRLTGRDLQLTSTLLGDVSGGCLPVSEVTIYEPDGTGTVTMTDCTNGTVTIGRTPRTVCQVNCCE